ncbi:MAG: hypothetical protein V4472_15480 [Pseudomonadota bacterium]
MRMVLIALAIAAVAAPGGAKDRNVIPEAIPDGKAESCIQTSRIRQSHVRNDWVIDFEMNDGKIYRNTLPSACPSLAFDESFAYKTSIGQLCSVDTITVLRGSAGPGPTCGLGEFQPIKLVPKH